jgi:hypothetical protein
MRRLGRWKLALRLLITAWVAAFGWNRSDQPPTNPDPLPPIAKSAALREGAILYEKDGEPARRSGRPKPP